ncbi:hypothetical protein, partial [Burkholderia pseudomallei]|uniref:hypothetical protein n=1 Tax=Burkholderia pseudomallei TaxID=28450 RepID=UPI0021F7AFCB
RGLGKRRLAWLCMGTEPGKKKAESMTIHAAFAAALYQVEKFGEAERLAAIFTALGLARLARAAHQARPFFFTTQLARSRKRLQFGVLHLPQPRRGKWR